MSEPLKIVAIGAGSDSFGRGVVADVLSAMEFNEFDSTLVLVDIDPEALDRMYKLAQLLKQHFGSRVTIEKSTNRCEALPGADYVIVSVAVQRYPLWEQDFRVPLAYGFQHVLGENGGPGALFHTLRSFELVLPICRDVERLCPKALVLNYTNPEARVIMAISTLTKVKAVGLCHGVHGARTGISNILERPLTELDIVIGGLNHFFWVTAIRDKQTGGDMYPKLRDRVLNDPKCPSAPPLVRKMLEVFGCYTYPSDDHIGEYLSFASEFTGLKWHYGQECRRVTSRSEEESRYWLDDYLSYGKPIDERVTKGSGEAAIPIILATELDRRNWEPAVNVPNDGAYVENLPPDGVVEVSAWVDAKGVQPEKIGPIPEALASFCRTQISLQKLIVDAYDKRSRNLLLQALLVDPVVNNVHNAEEMLGYMLDLQRDYLPAFE
jgi:alpha-galactosidase